MAEHMGPEDAAIFSSTFPGYSSDLSSRRLTHWHVNHLPDETEISDIHVSGIIGNTLARPDEIEIKKNMIIADRFNLNQWALKRIKAIFIALAKRYGLKTVSGADCYSFVDVREALSHRFARNEECIIVREMQILFWNRVPYQDLLEVEYMTHNALVYLPVGTDESSRIRKRCIEKHIRVKYSDLVSSIKVNQKKVTGGRYLTAQPRQRNSKRSSSVAITSRKIKTTYVADNHKGDLLLESDTPTTTIDPINTARREVVVCAGTCEAAKNLRVDLAVEVQKMNNLEIQSQSKIGVSVF
jgi:hypothetical protein